MKRKSVCAPRSTHCRKVSSSSTKRAATSSGTSVTPKFIATAPDLFAVGAKLEDTLRIGVARGDYPEARAAKSLAAERLARIAQPSAPHEQRIADGRTILIEERKLADGSTIGLRVDVTELKKKEASFRLLFDGNPLPMFLYDAETRQVGRRQ